MNVKPKAFIFDLDGVITDTAHYHYVAWKTLADELNIEFDLEFNEKLKGVSRMDSLNLILDKGNQINSFSEAQKEDMATKKNEIYKELIMKMTPDEVLGGIKELLSRLKSEGIKIGLASASKNAFVVLDRLEMSGDFDYVADAALIENSKPAPDVFLDVAKAFELEPRECVGVEDAQAGIEAINACPMFAVGIGSEEHLKGTHLLYKTTKDMSFEEIISEYKNWY